MYHQNLTYSHPHIISTESNLMLNPMQNQRTSSDTSHLSIGTINSEMIRHNYPEVFNQSMATQTVDRNRRFFKPKKVLFKKDQCNKEDVNKGDEGSILGEVVEVKVEDYNTTGAGIIDGGDQPITVHTSQKSIMPPGDGFRNMTSSQQRQGSNLSLSNPNLSETDSKRRKVTFSQKDDKYMEIAKNDYKLETQVIGKEDSFDCFAKYIATMLRNMPQRRSYKLQAQIVSIVIDAQTR